ncbi:MAG TPA: FlgO family outer membrane protein [Vicinamibacterales bacterium]|nr:FlgO family outer membrane protein [Vicinamibacterales bacterium]
MARKFILVFLGCWLVSTGPLRAQALNLEMRGLAERLSKAVQGQGIKNLAIVDFTDIQDQPTELGRVLADRLTAEVVSLGQVSVVDRANLKTVLAEHKLTAAGLVNPADAKKLGEFAGADAVVTGTITVLEGVGLTIKAISTGSAKVAAAGTITFSMTPDIQQLLNRRILSGSTGAGGLAGASTNSEMGTIVTKDFGPLRVTLKSVSPLQTRDVSGRSVNSVSGIRCTFEFTSRETQRSIVVGLNAVPDDRPPVEGRVLRTTLIDDHGSTWYLFAPDVSGLSIVSVGLRDPRTRYDPTDIGTALRRQDLTGANTATAPPSTSPTGGNPFDRVPYTFVFGTTTPLTPGQSLTVTMNFAQPDRDSRSPRPQFFQLVSEMVVGVVTSDREKTYSLHNVAFDHVTMPGGG